MTLPLPGVNIGALTLNEVVSLSGGPTSSTAAEWEGEELICKLGTEAGFASIHSAETIFLHATNIDRDCDS